MSDSKNTQNWHLNFKHYMEEIVKHPNYKGLSFNRKADGSVGWIATKKSAIGQERVLWAENKAHQLGFPIEPGVYAKVMLAVHPSKTKPCQICGKEMSLFYIYPNRNFVNTIEKSFNLKVDTLTDLPSIIKKLLALNIPQETIKAFLIKNFKLDSSFNQKDFPQIITMCELVCRNGNIKKLGPGAMSNFPDRLDGFHTYNRCCREKKDTRFKC